MSTGSTSSRSAEALDRIENLLTSPSFQGNGSNVNASDDNEEKRLLKEEVNALREEVSELKRTNVTITKNFKDEIYRLKSEVESIKASAVEAVSGLNRMNNPTSTSYGSSSSGSNGNINNSHGHAEKNSYSSDDVSEMGMDMGSTPPSPTRLTVVKPPPPPDSLTGRTLSKVKPTSHKVVLDFEAGDKLSQVLEERLLYTVYDKYKAEASGLMPLSRLIRFAKEFGIIAGGNCEQMHPMLVAGDLDVLYKASLLVKTNESSKSKASSYHQHFLAVKRNMKATNYAANQSMTVTQFIQVTREMANKLYANILEQQTCTSMDYLTPSQKAVASKAAMELLIQHKIFPTADRLGLIPWPLLNLDKTLSVSYEGSFTYRVLGLMAEPIEVLILLLFVFSFYKKLFPYHFHIFCASFHYYYYYFYQCRCH